MNEKETKNGHEKAIKYGLIDNTGQEFWGTHPKIWFQNEIDSFQKQWDRH